MGEPPLACLKVYMSGVLWGLKGEAPASSVAMRMPICSKEAMIPVALHAQKRPHTVLLNVKT